MSTYNYSDLAFQILTVHNFNTLFVASGGGNDIPIDDGKYLVAVNEKGIEWLQDLLTDIGL